MEKPKAARGGKRQKRAKLAQKKLSFPLKAATLTTTHFHNAKNGTIRAKNMVFYSSKKGTPKKMNGGNTDIKSGNFRIVRVFILFDYRGISWLFLTGLPLGRLEKKSKASGFFERKVKADTISGGIRWRE